MNQSSPDRGSGRARRALQSLALLLTGAAFMIAGLFVGARSATRLLFDVGPADGRWVSGFQDLERDGDSYVRWSLVPRSTVTLPYGACGPGNLRARLRRHFEDPALLEIFLNGVSAGRKRIAARPDVPYSVEEFPFISSVCSVRSQVILETSVANGRALGVVVDWLELTSESGFAPPASLGAWAAVLGVLLGSCGLVLSRRWAVALPAIAAAGLGLLASADPMAADRVLRIGTTGLILTGAVVASGALLARRSPEATHFGRAVLVASLLAGWAVRLPFLAPRIFYPDYRVHALVQETLERDGLRLFVDNLFTIQYARSLGLQEISGRWYPFPYPPGAYVLSAGLQKLAHLDALESLLALSVGLGALVGPLTVLLGSALGLPVRASALAGFLAATSPLLIRRIALGYFPGIAGLAVDLIVLMGALSLLRQRRPRAGRTGLLAVALCGAFLIYTQAIANFGILVTLLLAGEVGRRSPSPRATLHLAAAALLGLLLAFLGFYDRYVPVFQNIASATAQPESKVLNRLQEVRAKALASEAHLTDDDDGDPNSGADFDLLRGIRRIASRFWRFYGPFSFLIPPAFWVMLKSREDSLGLRLLAASMALPLVIGGLASALPSPNGFQHLKDLDLAVPAIALCLAEPAARMWGRRTWLVAAFSGLWIAYFAGTSAAEWSARVLPIWQF